MVCYNNIIHEQVGILDANQIKLALFPVLPYPSFHLAAVEKKRGFFLHARFFSTAGRQTKAGVGRTGNKAKSKLRVDQRTYLRSLLLSSDDPEPETRDLPHQTDLQDAERLVGELVGEAGREIPVGPRVAGRLFLEEAIVVGRVVLGCALMIIHICRDMYSVHGVWERAVERRSIWSQNNHISVLAKELKSGAPPLLSVTCIYNFL